MEPGPVALATTAIGLPASFLLDRRARRRRRTRLPRAGLCLPGTRVVAVMELRGDDEAVVLGEGVYLGQERPPDHLNPHAQGRARNGKTWLAYIRHRQAVIEIEGSYRMWSSELAWWGPADQWAAWPGLRGRRIVRAEGARCVRR